MYIRTVNCILRYLQNYIDTYLKWEKEDYGIFNKTNKTTIKI